ncbi:class I SAM-dependent methyltransferase [Methylovorus sp. MP688]|uniref:class I SAM-dependent methyltransferase n=1 Tax=Methylovorus sp. (strain MP688) TaxID=887061 RepID=UPI0001EC47A3|nr:methyltransferase domain-containing protein [Methylovorus sp. MP688]ADQ84683.1 methyltransferase type 11 [Methylovorus sp. MP688]
MSIDDQQSWLAKPIGAYLLEREQCLFDQAVADVFGFNALQIGLPQANLLQQCRMPFMFHTDQEHGEVLSDSTQLPFSANTIDLLLMPHTLDFSEDPHQTLREAERVLVAEGHLMISGFNPLSSWGVKRMLGKRQGYPWHGNFLPLLRIKDWLALLGFEIISTGMTCYAPPWVSARWLERSRFLDQAGGRWWPMRGGVYFVVARKRVLGMRVIRPNWNAARIKPRLVASPSQKIKRNRDK